MPAYDYACLCGFSGELHHSMNDASVHNCPDCGSSMRRVYAVFHLGHGSSSRRQVFLDQKKHEGDMRQEMLEEYGVEKFVPVRNAGVTEVYNDIKGQGSFVKERMQAETEKNLAAQKIKKKDWTTKAKKRADSRVKLIKEKRAKEDAQKRAIKI